MEDKESKRIISHEEMVKIKSKLGELMNSNCTAPDEDSSAPETKESSSRPTPTIAQVVEILKTLDPDGFDDDATDWSENYDDGKCWNVIRLYISPSKVEIITIWTDEHFINSETTGKVTVEGIENVAKLILALQVDVEDVENILYNLFEALANKIPSNWDEGYYSPAEIIEKLRKRYDVEYDEYPKPYKPKTHR